jgi:hypothetical protein
MRLLIRGTEKGGRGRRRAAVDTAGEEIVANGAVVEAVHFHHFRGGLCARLGRCLRASY